MSVASRGDILDMSKKIIVAAVVALFCATTFASLAGGADAAKNNYVIYGEVIDDDLEVSDYFYVYFSSEADNEKYIEAANAAFKAAGVPATFEMGKYGPSCKYDGDGNTSCFVSDGKTVVPVAKSSEDYINNPKAAFSFVNGWISTEEYEALDPVEQLNWMVDAYGMGAQKIPECGASATVKDYIAYLTLIKDDLVSWEATAITFSAAQEPVAWCYAFNQATKALGNDVFADCKVYYEASTNYIGVDFDGMTATWVKDGKDWKKTTVTGTEYINAKEVDFELKNGWISEAQYKTLSEKEQKNWTTDAMLGGYYMRNATGEVVEEAISMMLIIGVIGALILAVIIAIVLITVVRKKSGNKAA